MARASVDRSAADATIQASNAGRLVHRGQSAGMASMGIAIGVAPDKASIANARSLAEWNRSSGFFSRQCRNTRSRAGARFLLLSERSGGSSLRIALIVSAADSP